MVKLRISPIDSIDLEADRRALAFGRLHDRQSVHRVSRTPISLAEHEREEKTRLSCRFNGGTVPILGKSGLGNPPVPGSAGLRHKFRVGNTRSEGASLSPGNPPGRTSEFRFGSLVDRHRREEVLNRRATRVHRDLGSRSFWRPWPLHATHCAAWLALRDDAIPGVPRRHPLDSLRHDSGSLYRPGCPEDVASERACRGANFLCPIGDVLGRARSGLTAWTPDGARGIVAKAVRKGPTAEQSDAADESCVPRRIPYLSPECGFTD